MTIWLERQRPSDLQVMLPQALLALDQIRDQVMEPERRLAMLRALKDQVDAIQSAQSRPCPPRRAAVDGFGALMGPILTLEQRLNRSWCANLQRLLVDLGQPRYAGNARFAVYREWVLRHLINGLGHAVEYAVRAEQRAASGTWRSLHDLFVHLEGRDELDGPATPGHCRFHPVTDYKRLLLLGALGEYRNTARILLEIGPRLREWAADSALRRDLCVVGECELLRFDLRADAPPRRPRPGDVQPYHGWALAPARSYTDHLANCTLRECRQTAAA